NATNNEIKRAFRGLSIQLHPDKNAAEDANIQFRNLVSIYEVLKDPSKREKYDKVLREGLPNWKSALYYYRRMRKIGLYEGAEYAANSNTNDFLESTFNYQKMLNEMIGVAREIRRRELEEAKRQEELEKKYEEQARLRKEKRKDLSNRKKFKSTAKTEEELKESETTNTETISAQSNETKAVEQPDTKPSLPEESVPVTAEDVADDLAESTTKKRNKRKERKKRRDFSSDEDSDNAYT
ncbi:Uncharacterized protein F54F2.9, partial [Eumeta japonica]